MQHKIHRWREIGLLDSYVGLENSTNRHTPSSIPHAQDLWIDATASEVDVTRRDYNSLELKVMLSEDDGDDHFPPLSTSTSSVTTLAMLQ